MHSQVLCHFFSFKTKHLQVSASVELFLGIYCILKSVSVASAVIKSKAIENTKKWYFWYPENETFLYIVPSLTCKYIFSPLPTEIILISCSRI